MSRENIGLYVNSSYQKFLAGVLQQESKGYYSRKISCKPQHQIIELIQNNQEIMKVKLLDDLMNHPQRKEVFFDIRWGLFEKQNQSKQIIDILKNDLNNKNIMTGYKSAIDKLVNSYENQQKQTAVENQLQQNLQKSLDKIDIFMMTIQIINYFDLLSQGIGNIMKELITKQSVKACDLLNEYTLFWEHFSSCSMEFNDLFTPVIEIINEVYDELFCNYPRYPRFSFWRIFVKLWIKNVYKDYEFQVYIIKSFLKILKQRRDELLNYQFNDKNDSENIEGFTPNPFENITHELYDNFVKSKQQSKYSFNIDLDLNHKIIKSNEKDLLLNKTLLAIQDISLNEIYVHWYGHSEEVFEQPYEQLIDEIVKDSSLYYSKKKFIFQDDYKSYITFLDQDLSYIHSISYQPVLIKLMKVQKEILNTSISYTFENFILHLINDLNLAQIQMLKKTLLKNEETSDNPNLIQQQFPVVIDQMEQEQLEQEVAQMLEFFHQNPNINTEDLYLQKYKLTEPDPIKELIEITLKQNWNEIQCSLDVNQDETKLTDSFSSISDLPPPLTKMTKTFSQMKGSHHFKPKIPEGFIEKIQTFSYQNEDINQAFTNLKNFHEKFAKYQVQQQIKDEMLEIINKERELPKQLDLESKKFYHLTQDLDQMLIESFNICPQFESEQLQDM